MRTEQFRFFTEALKKERLRKYVPMFAAEAQVGEFADRLLACLKLSGDGVLDALGMLACWQLWAMFRGSRGQGWSPVQPPAVQPPAE